MWKYCNSISILSSICVHFFSFSFFSFFSQDTYSHIYHPLLFFSFFFFFSTFHFQNLHFYFFLQLSPFLLFFVSFSTIIFKYTQTGIKRKEKSPLLHHTATAAPPPHHRCSTTHIRLYFFSWSFIVVLFFFFFCSWSIVVVVLILDLLFKLNQFFMRARIFLWEQELFCEKKQIKEERERNDKILSAEIF